MKIKGIFCIAILILTAGLFTILMSAGVYAHKERLKETMNRLYESAQIGQDEVFKNLLKEHQHREDMPAPLGMRHLLTSLDVMRMGMGMAYTNNKEGKAELSWWTGEVGIYGYREENEDIIIKLMKDIGFSSVESEEGREDYLRFKKVGDKGVEEEVYIRKPENFTGGKKPACGVDIYWRVKDPEYGVEPQLKDLLSLLPVLRDDRIENKVYDELSALSVHSLAIGGTWTRYYHWDATFSPSCGKELYPMLINFISQWGYKIDSHHDLLKTYYRQKTGSFLYLSPADEEKRVNIRFQPES